MYYVESIHEQEQMQEHGHQQVEKICYDHLILEVSQDDVRSHLLAMDLPVWLSTTDDFSMCFSFPYANVLHQILACLRPKQADVNPMGAGKLLC